MEGVLLSNPVPVAWSMQHTYLHVGARSAGWSRKPYIVADNLAVNVASLHWVGDRIITLLCPIDVKYEWNDQTLRLCGWVKGSGMPSLCVIYHGSRSIKRKDQHCPSHWTFSISIWATFIPFRIRKWKQSWGFLLHLKTEGPFVLNLFWYHRSELYHQEASPTQEHSSKYIPFRQMLFWYLKLWDTMLSL